MNYPDILQAAIVAAENAIKKSQVQFPDDRGPCGFAWVVVSDGRSDFVKSCKKQIKIAEQAGVTNPIFLARFGRKNYGKGWLFWNPGQYFGQSVDIKESGAYAFAAKLREFGVEAYAESRLD